MRLAVYMHFGKKILAGITAILACTTVLLLSGCGTPSVPPTDAEIQNLLSEFLSQTERDHWKEDGLQEWRNAKRIPGGGTAALTLKSVAPGSTLQLSIKDTPGQAVTIRYGSKSNPGTVIQTNAKGDWEDILHPMDLEDGGAETISLSFESSGDFLLNRARVIPPSAPKTDAPSVIVILIDTLRQDHLGYAGYPRPTSPNLDAFAQDAVTFIDCWAQSSWTRPSVATILTSTLPQTHGAEDRGDKVSEDVTWLPEILHDAGYATYSVMTNPNCLPLWGFDKGFDQFSDFYSTDIMKGDDAYAVDGAMHAIDHRMSDRPFFMYLHTFSPHEPYLPEEPFKSKFAAMPPARPGVAPEYQEKIDLYDAEIAYIDKLLGGFFAHLKESNLYDSSLIAIVSDHGEEFGEHGGISHGKTLYQEQLQVPLLIKFPDNAHAGHTFNHPAEIMDIGPTILDSLDLSPHPAFEGVSLWATLEKEEPAKNLSYASLKLDRKSMQAAKNESEKLIINAATGDRTWFDLAADPGELSPYTKDQPDMLSSYIDALTQKGQKGLHILLTNGDQESFTLELEINGASMGTPVVRYPRNLTRIDTQDGAATVSLEFNASEHPNMPSAIWRQIFEDEIQGNFMLHNMKTEVLSEQDYAEVVIPCDSAQPLEIELRRDGQAIPTDRIRWGTAKEPASDAVSQVLPEAITAKNLDFDPTSLPEEFAVYVWYTPGSESLNMDELDPELIHALEGLGYLD